MNQKALVEGGGDLHFLRALSDSCCCVSRPKVLHCKRHLVAVAFAVSQHVSGIHPLIIYSESSNVFQITRWAGNALELMPLIT